MHYSTHVKRLTLIQLKNCSKLKLLPKAKNTSSTDKLQPPPLLIQLIKIGGLFIVRDYTSEINCSAYERLITMTINNNGGLGLQTFKNFL